MSLNDTINRIKNNPFVMGMTGGASGIAVSYWLDTIKTYHQTSKTKTLLETTKNLVKNDGIAALYRGVTFPLLGMGFEKAIVFGVQETVYNYELFKNKYYNTFFSGVCSGISCGIVVTPVEKYKILSQSGYTYNMIRSKVFNNKSLFNINVLRSLYRGYSATLIREGFGFGLYFSFYNYFKSYIDYNNFTPLHGMVCGALSGTTAWAIMYPSDVIKTAQQYDDLKFMEAIKRIYSNGGIKGFYKGYIPALGRAGILHAGVFGGIELYKLSLR
jgi:solute carrier family 25 carnitine/acylcarnitine transporter 20/29